jgi:hypothetical protein
MEPTTSSSAVTPPPPVQLPLPTPKSIYRGNDSALRLLTPNDPDDSLNRLVADHSNQQASQQQQQQQQARDVASLNDKLSASVTLGAQLLVRDIVLFLKGLPGEWLRGE